MTDQALASVGARTVRAGREALESLGSIRIAEFALFFLLIAYSVLPLPSIGFPWSNMIMAVIVLLALLRRPSWSLGSGLWVVPVFAGGLFYVTALSIFSEPTEFAGDWQGRTIRLSVTFAFALVIASGRIDLRSGLYGFFAALVVNVPLFMAGLLPAPYGQYLTGMIGDKNVAGLVYAVTGVLLLHYMKNPWVRYAAFLFSLYAVGLTGSRTSMAALAAAFAWILLAPRLPLLGRWALTVGIFVVVDILAEDFSQIGVFSDRVGSDLLRHRIDAASELKVQDAGFLGSGLGEAYVTFADEPSRVWYFHNSYWTTLVEGGWVWTAVVVALTVLVMLKPFTRELDRGQLIAQATGIVLLVCAVRLGEVFLTVPWALALGFALQMHARRDSAENPADDHAVGRGSGEPRGVTRP